MSTTAYLSKVKPATQYQEQIAAAQQQQQDALLREQIPVIVEACRHFDQNPTQPVTVALPTQPLSTLLSRELSNKGYLVEQRYQLSNLSEAQYQVTIAIGGTCDYVDPFESFLSAFHWKPAAQLPRLAAPRTSGVTIEEVEDVIPQRMPSIQDKSRADVSHHRKSKTESTQTVTKKKKIAKLQTRNQ